jgi:hypothetical protein
MEFMSVRHEFTEVFLDIGQEFSELQKFFAHITSSIRVDNANGMHMGKNLPDIGKNVSELTEE